VRNNASVAATEFRANEHEADWRVGLELLRGQSWQADLTCAAAPVQVEGSLPGGELFYFRSRHVDVCLAVGGSDPSDIPAWQQCEPHPDASYLPAGDGIAILQMLAQGYTEAHP
jgi:hypothetical protein